jgi:hypothetical protein
MESVRFKTGAVIAAEGITNLVNGQLYREESPEIIQAWIEMNYLLAKDPSVHGASLHLLYVGQKC